MSHVQLFLSAVTDEFRSYRDELRAQLQRPNVTVHVQEDFIATGTPTLDKLDTYIDECEAIIHLVGDMTGAWANTQTLEALISRHQDLAARLPFLMLWPSCGRPQLSYTQWEAYLAVYHQKPLLIAVPEPSALRDSRFQTDDAGTLAQQDHLRRLRALGRYPEITFANVDQLASKILRSAVLDLLVKAGGSRPKPIALPYTSLGALFKGRDEFMATLRDSLQRATQGQATAIVGKTLHGLGGVGKTRLAVEYAWQHRDDYTALLFVPADSPEDLQRNLAALVGPLVLNLPEQNADEEEARVGAALRWLQQNPGWFLIIDNVDTPKAAEAVESILARLHGGQVLITSRLSNWSGLVERLELDLLALEPATAFLLERTAARRRKTADDPADAAKLAEELGQLALALEQAGAYIEKHRFTFAQYRAIWRASQDKVSVWFDATLMHYPKSVATTWQTSFDQLHEPARLLLNRLSWLSPEPIPEALLDVDSPGASEVIAEPHAALAELEAYSLVRRAGEQPAFTVHPLVQDVARRRLEDELSRSSARPLAWIKGLFTRSPPRTSSQALVDALKWIDAAFVGHPADVRHWPALDPMIPHVRAAIGFADGAGVYKPTASLMSRLGLLLRTKARYSEAEPLFTRALKIRETTLAVDDLEIAKSLSHLGMLYVAQDQPAEAEPLLRRALEIRARKLPDEHPDVLSSRMRLALAYRGLGRWTEANALWEEGRHVSVFISCPGDARFDRQRVERLLERLNDQFASSGIKFVAVTWETQFYRAQNDFQAQIPKSSQCDIALAIFRGQLGIALPGDFPSMPNGETYPSGTAYEVLSAIDRHRMTGGAPDVFVFRCSEPPSSNLHDPAWSEIETQWQRLQVFFDRFDLAFQPFKSTNELETLVERALLAWLSDRAGFPVLKALPLAAEIIE